MKPGASIAPGFRERNVRKDQQSDPKDQYEAVKDQKGALKDQYREVKDHQPVLGISPEIYEKSGDADLSGFFVI
ncbi:hypothetical protein [Bhargavaea massiliensis]|uniref:hypothetical protein n=1 Tax=Bhargavaea massiliensis TaxID=2697500 RepID=UPI001BCFA009|nr:hypothetical protein [Bhargavaea massiliensis]